MRVPSIVGRLFGIHHQAQAVPLLTHDRSRRSLASPVDGVAKAGTAGLLHAEAHAERPGCWAAKSRMRPTAAGESWIAMESSTSVVPRRVARVKSGRGAARCDGGSYHRRLSRRWSDLGRPTEFQDGGSEHQTGLARHRRGRRGQRARGWVPRRDSEPGFPSSTCPTVPLLTRQHPGGWRPRAARYRGRRSRWCAGYARSPSVSIPFRPGTLPGSSLASMESRMVPGVQAQTDIVPAPK